MTTMNVNCATGYVSNSYNRNILKNRQLTYRGLILKNSKAKLGT